MTVKQLDDGVAVLEEEDVVLEEEDLVQKLQDEDEEEENEEHDGTAGAGIPNVLKLIFQWSKKSWPPFCLDFQWFGPLKNQHLLA